MANRGWGIMVDSLIRLYPTGESTFYQSKIRVQTPEGIKQIIKSRNTHCSLQYLPLWGAWLFISPSWSHLRGSEEAAIYQNQIPLVSWAKSINHPISPYPRLLGRMRHLVGWDHLFYTLYLACQLWDLRAPVTNPEKTALSPNHWNFSKSSWVFSWDTHSVILESKINPSMSVRLRVSKLCVMRTSETYYSLPIRLSL